MGAGQFFRISLASLAGSEPFAQRDALFDIPYVNALTKMASAVASCPKLPDLCNQPQSGFNQQPNFLVILSSF